MQPATRVCRLAPKPAHVLPSDRRSGASAAAEGPTLARALQASSATSCVAARRRRDPMQALDARAAEPTFPLRAVAPHEAQLRLARPAGPSPERRQTASRAHCALARYRHAAPARRSGPAAQARSRMSARVPVSVPRAAPPAPPHRLADRRSRRPSVGARVHRDAASPPARRAVLTLRPCPPSGLLTPTAGLRPRYLCALPARS